MLGCFGSYRNPYSPLLPVMLCHINIWLGPSDHFWLLTHDDFVVRWAPKKSGKINQCRDFKKKWDEIWCQNQSIEFEVVRLDRFRCPIALTIAVQNLCAVLLSHLFWRLHAITNHHLNISHSTRFLLFLSNSQVSPKFEESMLRVPFAHQALDSFYVL